MSVQRESFTSDRLHSMYLGAVEFIAIHWHAVNWGDFPTWVTGLLTGTAVIVTGAGLLAEGRRNRLDRLERSAAQIRSQAELISAWIHTIPDGPRPYLNACKKNPPFGQLDGINFVRCAALLRISNASHVPAYGLRYRFSAGSAGTFVGQFAVLPPRTVAEVAIPLPGYPRQDQSIPEIAFTDTADRHWRRTLSGALTGPYGQAQAFSPEEGAFPSVDEHPTMALPHPIDFQSMS